jgi:hypothetical protein
MVRRKGSFKEEREALRKKKEALRKRKGKVAEDD